MCVNLAQQDRKFTLETIEKMKQPKSTQHKKKISNSISVWWEDRKQEEVRHILIDSKRIKSKILTGSFTLSGSLSGTSIILLMDNLVYSHNQYNLHIMI